MVEPSEYDGLVPADNVRKIGAKCDLIALDAARTIEAIFAAEHKGGAIQRRARIHVAILNAIEAVNEKLNPREERIQELERALKPFQETARRMGWDSLQDNDPDCFEHLIEAPADDVATGAYYCLTIEEFRQAAKVAKAT